MNKSNMLLNKAFLFLMVFLAIPSFFARAQEDVNVYFFYSRTCPHCIQQKPYMEALDKQIGIKVNFFELGNAENDSIFDEVGKELHANTSYYPFTAVGQKYFIGWSGEKGTGRQILEEIKNVQSGKSKDALADFFAKKNATSSVSDIDSATSTQEKASSSIGIPNSIKVPFIGDVSIDNLSLPVLTLVFGAVDGFNPCAMWVLVFLISLLIGMHDRKRMFILGSAFIGASALLYFLIMVSWLKVFQLAAGIPWIAFIVAAIAFYTGGYNIKEYFTNKTGECKVVGQNQERKKIFEQLKAVATQKNFLFAFCGIIALAVAVNIVELGCSLGLPVVYTQILSMNNLPALQYYLYLFLYIFVFMFDDMVVFFISMVTLHATGITTKYSRISGLIGGIVMILVGIYLAQKGFSLL
ncbi:hypothetical protein KBC01_01995 [Candidatus Parcubacteria bacterium]|nr:hypothetical protein [Candidatus Parcubacteria bacterium]